VRTPIAAVLVVGVLAVASGCTDDGDGGDEDDPALLRIDGPAQVDPDFDPFATVPGSAPAVVSPTTTDG